MKVDPMTVPAELEDEIRRYAIQPDGSGQCPFPAYARLRELAPIHRTPDGIWLVTGYKPYLDLMRDPRISRQEAAKAEMGNPADAPEHIREAIAAFPNMLINQDGENHLRLRRLISKVFLPGQVESWRPLIEKTAREVVDRALTLDEYDFVTEVGYPLPERVMTDLIGVPQSDRAIWSGWSRDISKFSRARGGQAADLAGVQSAMASFYGYMCDLVRERQKSPKVDGSDILSIMIRAEEEGDRLSEVELVSSMVTLTQAAHETTANLVPNGVTALLLQRELYEQLVADPTLVEKAVEEMLRTHSSSPATLPRVALEDIEYKGVTIPKGERISFLTNAANRDPASFEAPDDFNPLRPGLSRHLAFGAGAHNCLGQHLARIEAVTLVREVVTRIPNLRLMEVPRYGNGRARHLERMLVRNS